MAQNQKKPRVVDTPSIIESYASKHISTSFDGGAVVVTLGTTRFLPDRIDDAPKEGQHPTINVTVRLALSPAAAVELINALNKMLSVITRAVKNTEQPPQTIN